MHEDPLERLTELRDIADSAAQKLAAAQVSSIEVGPAWRQQLGAEANTTLRQKLNDNTGYRDGHWTPATTA